MLTENQWLMEADPVGMIMDITSDGDYGVSISTCAIWPQPVWKLRLIACAIYRATSGPIGEQEQMAVDLCEKATGDEDLDVARSIVNQSRFYNRFLDCASYFTGNLGWKIRNDVRWLDRDHYAVVADLIRDIIGNPFRQHLDTPWIVQARDSEEGGAVVPHWTDHAEQCCTADVRRVAIAIERSRCFGDLPVLADALEDAGCKYESLLNHFRADRPHALGCWALNCVMNNLRHHQKKTRS